MSILDDLHDVMGGNYYGNYLAVCCPFHGDSHPSMMVYEDYYSCKSCGAHGRTENLLRKFNSGSISRIYAVVDAPVVYNPFHSWMKSRSLSSVLHGAWEFANLNPQSCQYLVNRGITHKIRRKLGIGYRDGFYTFPVIGSENSISGAFVRTSPELAASRYYVPKGQDPNLLYSPSWKSIEKSPIIFLTFGAIDAITIHMLGFASMSTLSGKTLDVSALEDIRKHVVFIPDLMEDREANKIASRLGWRGSVLEFPYPNQTKDLNEVYKIDPELIREVLQSHYDNLERSIRNCIGIDLASGIIGTSRQTGSILSSI